MALGLVVAQDLANMLLIHYERGKTLSQTTQDKPLLRVLEESKKSFPAGILQISDAVQGQYMSDTPGFTQGYQEDDALNFGQAQNALRNYYPWKEIAWNLIITHTELKKSGITISDHQEESEHTDRELDVLTDVLENRIADYDESIARGKNYMFWGDGTQDPKQVPGIRSILLDVTNAGTTGGLNRATYWWWQNRSLVGANKITASGNDQTLSRRLRSELRQLRRFGGRPMTALCGESAIEALELEVQEKGVYTQEGFTKEGKTDLGMAKIRMRGLGTFEYDPTLDDIGWSKRIVILDTKHLKLRPMQDEDDKLSTPERPYQYMVFLRTKTWTGGLTCDQLNAQGVYEVA